MNSLIELIIVIMIFVFSKSLSEKKKIESNKKNATQKLDKRYFEKEKKDAPKDYNKNKAPNYKSISSLENKVEYEEVEDSLEKKLIEWESNLYSESEYEKDAYEKEAFNYDENKKPKIYSELDKDILKGVIFSEIISKPKCKKNNKSFI